MTLYFCRIPKKSAYGGSYSRMSSEKGRELLKAAAAARGYRFDEADISFTQRQKPYFHSGIPLKFNISHCDGLVCCAVSDGEVGVDCETPRRVSDNVIRKYFGEDEAEYIRSSSAPESAYARLWTLKESYVKYTGEGVSAISGVHFDILGKSARFLCDCAFAVMTLPDGYFISVCTTAADGKRGAVSEIRADIRGLGGILCCDIPLSD